jgi:hypothetical protein
MRADPLRQAGNVALMAGLLHDSFQSLAREELSWATTHEGPTWAGVTSPARLTLLAITAMHAGRDGDVDRIVRRLRAVAGAGAATDPVFASLDAMRSLARGDTVAAIRQLEPLAPRAPRESLAWGMTASLGLERLTLARLLLRHGQPQRALALAEGFDGSAAAAYLFFLPASLEIRRSAAARLGQQGRAEQYGARLRALGWSNDGPT